MVGSVLFHFGLLAAIGGHVIGILVPRSWTEAIGINDTIYHSFAVVAGTLSGIAIGAGSRSSSTGESASDAFASRPPAATSSSTRC